MARLSILRGIVPGQIRGTEWLAFGGIIMKNQEKSPRGVGGQSQTAPTSEPLGVGSLNTSARQEGRVLRSLLAFPKRRQMLVILQSPNSASNLADKLKLRNKATWYHLLLLLKHGLIERSRVDSCVRYGRRSKYTEFKISPRGFSILREIGEV
ncbi:MAG: hypothetical protein V1909_03895 [Candidatus Micrarchaeota archaeon]